MANAAHSDHIRLDLSGIELYAWRSRSLGNWTYLIASEGDAIVVDPQRHHDRYLEVAREERLHIRHVVETHVHSDYLSGALALSRSTGAQIVAPGLGKYEFGHNQAWDGDEVIAGGAALTCISTPGHTFDHVAWQLNPASSIEPVAVFTGGSLLRGGAGRTDLMGEYATARLSELQLDSLRRLSLLPSTAFVLPTHGGGSTCAAGTSIDGVEGFTTLAIETLSNSYLTAADAAALDAHLGVTRAPIPAYFPHVALINRKGVGGVGRPGAPDELDPGEFARLAALGAVIVDVRDRWEFADTHIPGALNIEALDTFASHLGSMVPFGTPVALVIGDRERALVADLVTAAFEIGYRVEAILNSGIEGWQMSGFALESYPSSDIFELIDEVKSGSVVSVLDVRDPSEWATGIVPGSTTVSLRALQSRAPELHDALLPRAAHGRISVACRGGARAAVAASYLNRIGIPVRAVLGGGIPDLLGALPLVPAAATSYIAE